MSAITPLTEAQKMLRFQQLTAGGRRMAWAFTVEHNWNLESIREELAEYEDIRNRLIEKNSPMTPGHSPRIFADAYIATLNEAIEIIEIQQLESVAA